MNILIPLHPINSKDDSNISKVLLFVDHSFNNVKNTSVLIASTKFIIPTKRSDSLFIKIDIYLFVCVQFIFSFYQQIACSFILHSIVFSLLTTGYFRLFCKIIYIIRFLFL